MAKKTPTSPRTTKTPTASTDGNSTPPRARTRRAVPAPGASALEPTQLEIAERAYYLFLQRGGSPGGDFDDWVRAERELRDLRLGK